MSINFFANKQSLFCIDMIYSEIYNVILFASKTVAHAEKFKSNTCDYLYHKVSIIVPFISSSIYFVLLQSDHFRPFKLSLRLPTLTHITTAGAGSNQSLLPIMAEKVTVMVLKVVDLQCSCCYKKIKKLLCKFPQIRDQIYDEKQNQVIITVVCCSPEKLRDKLCCKGWKVIKSIEIKELPKPKPEHQPKPKPEPKSEPEHKPKLKPEPKLELVPEPKPKSEPKVPKLKPELVSMPEPKPEPKREPEKLPSRPPCCGPCSEGYVGGPCYHGYGRPTTPLPPPPPQLLPLPLPPCCGPCSEGYAGGPCYHGYGRPTPPPPLPPPPPPPPPLQPPPCCGPCSEGYAGGPCYHGYGSPPPPLLPPPPPLPPQLCYDGYGYGYGGGIKRHYMSRCDYYFSEENPQGCTIM